MKQLILFICLTIIVLTLNACSGTTLTVAKAQTAVDKAFEFTKKGGSVKVSGVREMSQDNSAQANLQFDGFQYNADMMGVPISKDQKAPAEPDRSSPTFWQDVYKYGTEQTGTKNFSGQGTATFKRYNDGRFVLTDVQFSFVSVSASVEID